jgi:cytochrome c peroxidase
MHDGAAPSLEAQVLTPLLDPAEMANASFQDLEARLSSIPAYARRFNEAFGAPPDMARIGAALAAYQRTLISAGSPFDRWRYAGQADALSPRARQGFALFTGKAGCARCHLVGEQNALFTDNAMHNTGIGVRARVVATAAPAPSPTVNFAAAGDRGRQEVTGLPADLHRYRTPALRNVALTAPYMHDGSVATLADVVRFYDAGGAPNPNLDPGVKPLHLEDTEVEALVAFLHSLTGANAAALANEGARAGRPAADR